MQDIAWSLLRIGAAAYVGLCLYLFLRQRAYVFHPDREIRLTPDHLGLTHENLALLTTDGETLHAWWLPAASPRGTVLYCHGNAGNIGDRLDTAGVFLELGLNVLLFDYRGYGRSTGRPTETGTYRDAAAAWEHLVGQREVPPERILVFGESLGGAVAAWVAEQRRPAGLILDSTFTSVPDMAARLYPYLPARWLARIRYNTLARLSGITCPVLVLHSPEDEVVPFEHGRRLYGAARGPKQFVTLHGSHNTARDATAAVFVRAVAEFCDRCLGPRPAP